MFPQQAISGQRCRFLSADAAATRRAPGRRHRGRVFTVPTRGRRNKQEARSGARGIVPDQMGGEASWEQGALAPGAPVNLCPESVTSRCGSLTRAKYSSFSFESFLVSGPLGSPPSRPTPFYRESPGWARRGRWLERLGPLSAS